MDITMTANQIEFYRKNGFIQINNILTKEELDELRQYVDESMEDHNPLARESPDRSAYFRVLNQKVNSWRDHAGMSKYSFHPRFSNIALQLTGANGIRFFHDHILFKMPGDSKPTPWHQDFPYWPMNEPGALSIWITLDDVNEENGCMMFVPESHKAGKFQPINLAEPEDLFQFSKNTEVNKQTPVICRLKAGSCTFHDGLTFHYAHANQTNRPRRVLAIIFYPEDTTFSGKNHIVTNELELQENQPIKGRLFPLLARTAD
ncbi:phytanoyl-CoA dioxygenase family protein [Bacillus sp. USDA818B3_A]|uniref:phytanoyl-CoA dioxygenase family protein n=1 Tax=Bacillus sp. USDA818B3_A TaxID=2698834 RepID=UPI0013683043|nr:phytanoyl-CoA dioxygenase family protein [Bacillus sp. USDA818B3_A]